jgi:[NiFe] hydrogenase diaphorase moiety large subunit
MNSSLSNTLTFDTLPKETGLEAAIAKRPAEIIDQIAKSGIRGRGGVGFPVSTKWNLCAAVKAENKYVISNANEGEPGTFKDRIILGRFPDLVFEGMAIAARAVGAENGIVYLKSEYSFLLPRLDAVLSRRREKRLLGKRIFDSEDFNFDIQIHLGSGAYVCGEETALIESLEGYRGEPRNRPPFPMDTGFLGCPTVVNNVETLAWIPCIMAEGAEWFRRIGTEISTGSKLLSVSGDCTRPGVYELPLGVTVSQLIDEVGGENTKAVLFGGAAGQLIPVDHFHRKIAYEDVSAGGSVIIFGKDRDMLSVARNFLEFFCEESCGQCTPCREGNPLLLKGVKQLMEGRCSSKKLNELILLGETMQLASKCGLGQSSPNMFLGVAKYFKKEILGRNRNVA